MIVGVEQVFVVTLTGVVTLRILILLANQVSRTRHRRNDRHYFIIHSAEVPACVGLLTVYYVRAGRLSFIAPMRDLVLVKLFTHIFSLDFWRLGRTLALI